MPLRLRRELFVGRVPTEDGCALVLEAHGEDHIHIFSTDDRGEPRGFIRLTRESVGALIEQLVWLQPRDDGDAE